MKTYDFLNMAAIYWWKEYISHTNNKLSAAFIFKVFQTYLR